MTPPADAPRETIVGAGLFFDGVSARPHPVRLRLGDLLTIEGEGVREDWSLFDVRANEAPTPAMRIGHRGRSVRVEFTDARLAAGLIARCPDLRAGAEGTGGAGGVARFVAWSLAAGGLVLLAAVYAVPVLAGRIAPLVPPAVEARFGEAVEGQVGRLLGEPAPCAEPAGRAVLDRLVAHLAAGADLPPPRVGVRRSDTANALALPGGRVIVLSGLLAQARTADEFAGVLGHEFGHIAARDPTRAVITAGGVSFLLSLVLGDMTGSTLIVAVGEAAISAGYSRDAERAADAYAVALMRRAGGDPAALAAILERIDAEGDDDASVTGFLRSHPYTRERAAAIRRQAGTDGQGRSILSEEEWRDLRGLCPGKPDAPKSGAPKPDGPKSGDPKSGDPKPGPPAGRRA